jgi:hypothetical protein
METSEASKLFESLRVALPALRMETEALNSGIDLSMRVPVQDQLPFEVDLALSNNVLHLTAGDALWLEWSPATDPAVVERYRDAVLGLLSGRYRIVEYGDGSVTVKAELQRPIAGEWDPLGTWYSFIPTGRHVYVTTRVLQVKRS